MSKSKIKDPKIQGIYRITCVPTGDTYVGASSHIYARFREIMCIQPNKRFRELRAKYSKDSFSIEVIQECRLTEDLNMLERYWIGQLAPSLNVTKGGSACFYTTTLPAIDVTAS